MDEQQRQALAEAFAQMGREFAKSLVALSQSWRQFWESADSENLRTVVDYYRRHPEELDRMVAARERTYREDSCHCFCQWQHHAGCGGAATTSRPFGSVWVPMCPQCAEQVDQRRTAGARPPDSIGRAG